MSSRTLAAQRLDSLEKIIERGMKSVMEVGAALLEIRDARLYKSEYTTFNEYCKVRWGFERTRAQNFITAAKTVRVLEISNTSKGGVEVTPANELQARELARAEDPVATWAEVVDAHEPHEITAAVIREHVEGPVFALQEEYDNYKRALESVTRAVQEAVAAGATSLEIYAAYQSGFQ